MFRKRLVLLVCVVVLGIAAVTAPAFAEGETLLLLVGGILLPEIPGVNPWTQTNVSPIRRVDIVDIQGCASVIGQPASQHPSCDADQSGGSITIIDVLAFASYWNREWDAETWFNADGLVKLERGFDINDLRWLAEQLMSEQPNLRGDVGRTDDEGAFVIGHDNKVDLVDLIVMLDALLPMKRIRFRDLDLPESIRSQLEDHMAK